MGVRINFINPFGTPAYNGLITETLEPYLNEGNELVVTNVENCPENCDWWYPKHLTEEVLFECIIDAEKKGFDAVIVGCCNDPGVRAARELVDIPVVGTLEATMQHASYFGHDYLLVTDHRKSAAYMRDLVRLYGQSEQCKDVRYINWYITDMINDYEGVAKDALAASTKAMEDGGVESVILACTIISACTEKWLLTSGEPRNTTILNPNTFALKMAESLGLLHQKGAYGISRVGYYEKMQQRRPEEFVQVREKYGRSTRFK
ncbi:Asp/Glu/hydantoin racemase [Pseudomonas sp. GV105]|uniref:aspartate/glutamate racemase family protein n=1 Tax=unclassified Pseudomonas TaxID=196821 RepID=UPI0001E298EC|nr:MULTISPECIES: aspartate/glutamate racemase family protein [unclassified Pseudomonas]MBP1143170.1 Asp/Glu/hydantoin racemase [Pseudomonas sp. PvP027]PUB37676.1 Asp/Glu/hydantoin racemase [Pseudomonas sp. GV105]